MVATPPGMDRAQLRYLLHSGPSRVLDVRRLHFSDGCAPLFRVGSLNSAIIIKQSGGLGLTDDKGLPPIANKIYLPYDRDRPEDGGKSFFFTPDNLRLAFGAEKGSSSKTPADLAADIELFLLFDKLPSFSPYLMKDVLERAGVEIPKGYFNLPEREVGMIKDRVKARLRPLVTTALGGEQSVGEASIESLVEKLWELTDLEGLAPLVAAFRITMEQAPETFYCWLGITFFENEYLKLQPELKKMATWMHTSSTPRDPMPRETLAHYKNLILRARQLLQQHWKSALDILNEYSSTYDMLISASGSAQRFIEFLHSSKDHFWTLGGSLGRLEQSVGIWNYVCSKVDYKPLGYEQGVELFNVLNVINAPNVDKVGAVAASA